MRIKEKKENERVGRGNTSRAVEVKNYGELVRVKMPLVLLGLWMAVITVRILSAQRQKPCLS